MSMWLPRVTLGNVQVSPDPAPVFRGLGPVCEVRQENLQLGGRSMRGRVWEV